MTALTAPVPETTPRPAAPERSSRVTSIDGLRGIAALLVVLFHLHGAVSRTATDWLWAPVDWIARNGAKGVDIFFVISGFVIALSVSRGVPTPSYFGRFIVRRSIRLDPPYWSAIALEVLLLHLTLRLFPEHPVVLPSTAQVMAHLVYLQDLLGYGNIVVSFWTLCYEIQFYAFFVGLLVLQQYLPAFFRTTRWTTVFAGGLFLLSLWARFIAPASAPHGLAIDRWYQFFIGTLTYHAVSEAGVGRMRSLYAAWAALVVVLIMTSASPMQLLPVIVSAWLVAAARDPRWGALFASRPLQFLGAISYSLYLYHASVGWRFVTLMQKLIPGQWSAPTAVGVYVVGIVFAVAFATLMWRFIERPCLKFCQRIRLPTRAAAAPVGGASITPASS